MLDKKVDRRILHTKKFIKDALIELLRTKTIDKISIRELCAKADINRNTFYAHYSMPEDVLKEIEGQLVEEYEKILEQETGATEQILQYVKENKDTIPVLFDNRSSRLKELWIEKSRSNYMQYIQQVGIRCETMAEYLYLYTSAGAAQIIQQWMSSGYKQSVEQISHYIRMLLEGCCKTALESSMENV